MKFYYVTNIFYPHTFDNEATALLKFFENSTEMHFVYSCFLNERNIKTSHLMIHIKYTVVHYVNLNSRFTNQLYLRAVQYAIFFYDFLFMFILTRLLSKTLLKNYDFLIQISKTHFLMQYIIKYQDSKSCDTKMVVLDQLK